MPGQFPDQLPICHIPEFDEAIIATASQKIPIRTNLNCAYPALVSSNLAYGLGFLSNNRPPYQSIIKAAGHQRLTILGKRQATHPGIVSREGDLAAIS